MPICEGDEEIWNTHKEKMQKEAELLVQPGRNPLLLMTDLFPEAEYEVDSTADTSHFYTAKYDRRLFSVSFLAHSVALRELVVLLSCMLKCHSATLLSFTFCC